MKRGICILLIAFMGIMLTACEKNVKPKEDKTTNTTSTTKTGLQVGFTDKELGEEMPEYRGEWRRTTDSTSDDNPDENKIYIYRATKQYLWFTFSNMSTDAVLMRAEKEEDEKYHFTFCTKPSGHCYAPAAGVDGLKGSFTLKDGVITDEMHYREWGEQPSYQYKLTETFPTEPTMNVFDYLDDYHKAYKFYDNHNLYNRNIGMTKNNSRVSYFYHDGGDGML